MKKILFTTLLLSASLCLSAQSLYVQTIDNGQQTAFAFEHNPKITFNNRAATVETRGTSPSQQTFQLTNVQNFSFVSRGSSSIRLIAEDLGIQLFPNPVKDELTLEIEKPSQGITYRIFDFNGRSIATGQALDAQTKIDMQGFTAGNYILSVVKDGQQVQSFKIVKQ